jgi:hypothetical protein
MITFSRIGDRRPIAFFKIAIPTTFIELKLSLSSGKRGETSTFYLRRRI